MFGHLMVQIFAIVVGLSVYCLAFFVVVVIVVAALTAGHFSSAEAKTSTQFGHFRFCYLISRKFIFNCHRKFCINNLADCRVSVM